jgi:hypothetical protein
MNNLLHYAVGKRIIVFIYGCDIVHTEKYKQYNHFIKRMGNLRGLLWVHMSIVLWQSYFKYIASLLLFKMNIPLRAFQKCYIRVTHLLSIFWHFILIFSSLYSSDIAIRGLDLGLLLPGIFCCSEIKILNQFSYLAVGTFTQRSEH